MKQEKSAIERYNDVKKSWLELLFRLYLGMQQVRYRPYYCLTFIPVFIILGIMWWGRYILISADLIPKILVPLFMTVTSVLLALMLIILLIATIKQFGIWASREWESKLVYAFNDDDLKKGGYPILISSKYGENGILILEFYSQIHKRCWLKRQPDIEEQTGLHIRSIEYGGKNNTKGNHKVIYATWKGVAKYSPLHDEELDKELENVD